MGDLGLFGVSGLLIFFSVCVVGSERERVVRVFFFCVSRMRMVGKYVGSSVVPKWEKWSGLFGV